MSVRTKLDLFKPRPYWVRYIIQYLTLFLGSIFTRTTVYGRHNLPKNGPFIIASNHFNVFDPPFVVCGIRRPINFLAASDTTFTWIEYFALWIYGFIPTNRTKLGPSTIKMSKKVLKNKNVLGIFPEGDTLSNELRPSKAGVVFLSTMEKSPIVPVGVYGLKKSLWDYTFSGVRPRITIKIGKPFGPYSMPNDRLKKEEALIDIGHKVMCRIAALLPSECHGYYKNDLTIKKYEKENLS